MIVHNGYAMPRGGVRKHIDRIIIVMIVRSTDTYLAPRVGMLATVRNRRGLIRAVEPCDSTSEGRLHLVTIEYLDTEGPHEDTLIWEREVAPRLLEPTALPDPARGAPMPPAEFDALVRATAGPPSRPTSILMVKIVR